jgi:hypothetical protein
MINFFQLLLFTNDIMDVLCCTLTPCYHPTGRCILAWQPILLRSLLKTKNVVLFGASMKFVIDCNVDVVGVIVSAMVKMVKNSYFLDSIVINIIF